MIGLERWRSIPGYVGLYEVSDQGRVRGMDRITLRKDGRKKSITGCILREKRTGQSGYPAVNLNRNGSAQTWPIHRLVLLAFVGPLPQGMQTRHLNGDSQDNRLANLKYGTPLENTSDKFAHGTFRTRSAVITHCRRNHEFTAENTGHDGRGYRWCRQCARDRDREAKRAIRACAVAVSGDRVHGEAPVLT